MKKRFVLLVVLLLTAICLPVMGEDSPNPPPSVNCEGCGGAPVYCIWVDEGDSTHVLACPHGVKDEASRSSHVPPDGYTSDGTSHWKACTLCKHVLEKDDHYNVCTAPDVCMACSAPYTSGDVQHASSATTYTADGEYHWYVCDGCNAQLSKSMHAAACDKPGACAECGVAYTGDRIRHDIDFESYGRDGTHHWRPCKKCDAQDINRSEHYAACDKPSACMICQATCGADVALEHVGIDKTRYLSDGEYHWYACSSCDEKIDHYEHMEQCDKPGVCLICSVPYTDGNILHTGIDRNAPTYGYDGESHWIVCSNCDKPSSEGNHSIACDKPGVCAVCQAACGADVALEHVGIDKTRYLSDGEYHWYACSGCDEKIDHFEHMEQCDQPGVCLICGVPYTDGNILHTGIDRNAPTYGYDGESHWIVCSNCDKPSSEGNHYTACDKPGVCAVCGAAYTGASVNHTIDRDAYQYDDTYDWWICTTCNEQVDRNEHVAVCTRLGVCANCGAAYAGGNIAHNFDWDVYEHDETAHWHTCLDCGNPVDKYQHVRSCANPDVCEACGVSCAGEISHRYDWNSPLHDEIGHWTVCLDCGEPSQKEAHWSPCTNPGVCETCGEVCSGALSHNTLNSPVQHDAEYHWYICQDCGQETHKFTHRALCKNPTVCERCGAPCSAENAEHQVDYTQIQHNDQQCWYLCMDCGEAVEKNNHKSMCDNPTVCQWCGEPCAGEPSHFSYQSLQRHNESEHWYICLLCNKDIKREAHYSACDNLGVCAICNIQYTGDNVEHWGVAPDQIEYDAASHWWYCPTCNQDAYQEPHIPDENDSSVCGVCGASLAHSHTVVADPAVPATCTEAGLTAGNHCGVCAAVITAQTAVPALGHTAVADPAVPATCTEAGLTAGSHCGVCAAVITAQEAVEAVGHKYEIASQKAATCTADGDTRMKCANCGTTYRYTQKKATGHDWQETETIAATCLEKGKTVETCAACHETRTTETDALTHSFKLTEDTKPTCTDKGVQTNACEYCGETETVETNALGHAFGSFVAQDNGTHAAECAVCGERRSKACVMKETTVGTLTIATCSICGRTTTKVAPPKATPTATPTAAPDATPTPEPVETPEPTPSPLEKLAIKEVITTEITNATIEIPVKSEPPKTEPADGALPEEDKPTGEDTPPEPSPLPENAKLTVHEQTLVLEENAGTVRMFTLGLTVEGEEVDLAGAVTIKIPCEEAVNMRLVLILPDGSITEIPYEIVDGVIIFETDVVGTFALIPVE